MPARPLVFRLLLIAACMVAIGTIFVPIVFSFIMVGFAAQGGVISLWGISPLLSSLTIVFLVAVTARVVIQPAAASRGHLSIMGVVALTAPVAAVVYMFSPWAEIGFHPFALAGIFVSGILLVVAGRLVPRPQGRRGFQFSLQVTFLYVTLAALVCGFIGAAIR